MTDIVVYDNDIKLSASVYGSPAASPLLFLHAFSMSRDTWEEIAQRFADKHQVWTLDFRGHGGSDRATAYQVQDFVRDAEAALAVIGRPTIVVGHSIGAVAAGTLAQNAHPLVRAAFLEEPPWFLGDGAEWERTPFPRIFAGIAMAQAKWQAEHASLSSYEAFLASAPSALGGVNADHISHRHLLSHASGLQRQDNLCWRDAGPHGGGRGLSAIDTARPFQCPTRVVVGETRLGSAFLDEHTARLTALNPAVEVLRYTGCGHDPHRMTTTEQRFADDLLGFVASI